MASAEADWSEKLRRGRVGLTASWVAESSERDQAGAARGRLLVLAVDGLDGVIVGLGRLRGGESEQLVLADDVALLLVVAGGHADRERLVRLRRDAAEADRR